MLSWQVKLFYFILQDASIMTYAYKESGTNYDPSLALITCLGGGGGGMMKMGVGGRWQ